MYILKQQFYYWSQDFIFKPTLGSWIIKLVFFDILSLPAAVQKGQSYGETFQNSF